MEETREIHTLRLLEREQRHMSSPGLPSGIAEPGLFGKGVQCCRWLLAEIRQGAQFRLRQLRMQIVVGEFCVRLSLSCFGQVVSKCWLGIPQELLSPVAES